MTRDPLRRRLVLSSVLTLLAGLACATTGTGAQASPTPGTTRYAVERPACATDSVIRCFAVRRVDVEKGTAGATAYTVPSAVTLGPAGGYTPADLASAYGYDPDTARSSQTVAIIDWYDAPHAAADLATFDAHYGLAAETAASFRKVNQQGLTTPLPESTSTDARESSVEIDLDVQSVRAVCHTCSILLVEADGPTDADLATAENTAAAMGATEISNSWGGAETAAPSADLVAAFDHPGVVITASTGDDGWHGWDHVNDTGGAVEGAASYPATDPHVVSVGGTSLTLTSGGARADETVWNTNGPADTGPADGASGGGCSTLFAAPAWQAAYPGYAATGCAGQRLATDVSAVADPATGLDIIDTDAASRPGWMTIGGTSLASPVVAAMYALAGGSGGVSYPAATLYENRTVRRSALFDVIEGGNSFCGGASTAECSSYSGTYYGAYNPNALGVGVVDCSYPATGNSPTPPPISSQCNAASGYDGASGVGAPSGSGAFTVNSPAVALTRTATTATTASLLATVAEPIGGITPTSYVWSFGDGSAATTTARSEKHVYARAGTYTATVTVTDSVRQRRSASVRFVVGHAAAVTTSGPASLHHARAGAFTARATTVNTGARITRVTWAWGDRTTTVAASAKHAWARTGTYTVRITVLDSTGVTTTTTRRVKVVT